MGLRNTEVDCDRCKNYNDKCEECEHYERELYDYYEPCSNEELAEMEKRRWREAEDKLINNIIGLTPEEAEKLAEVFETVKQFRTIDHYRSEFIPVHAGDDHLSACNSHVLAYLHCNVPPAVQGKNIVRVENGRAFVYNKKVPWEGRALESLTAANKRIPLSQAALEYDLSNSRYLPQIVVIRVAGTREIFLDKKYFDLALKTLEGEITLVHGGQSDAVIFEGTNGKILVMPLRTKP